jgi:hypothetical protein
MIGFSLKVVALTWVGEMGTFCANVNVPPDGSNVKKSADTEYRNVLFELAPDAGTNAVRVPVLRLVAVVGRPLRRYFPKLRSTAASVTPSGSPDAVIVALHPEVDLAV